jgi:hypothetical protein
MLRRAVAVAFIVGMLVVGSRGQESSPKSEVQRNREILAARSKVGSLRPILKVLDKANLSASLEFSGHCESLDVRDFPEFPQFRAPVASGGPPLQTLREIFADDPAMQVTQDPDGTIRMIESGVPTDILNVKIGHISFEGSGANQLHAATYSPNLALNRVFEAEELNLFLKAHDIEWPVFGSISIMSSKTPPLPAVPHLSGSLDNVTLSEALDHILKTFPGIWIYENCSRSDTKKRLIYFHFFHLQKLGTSEEYVQ